jgi:membrane protein required for colicin V production
MSTVDFILLGLLALGAISGYRTGLIIEVIAIVALVLGIVGGIELLHVGMDLLASWYNGFGPLLPIFAFLLIFVVIMILVNLLGRILKRVVDWTPLGVFDNIGGAALGLLKWALGLSIVLWIFSGLGIDLPESMMNNSTVYPVVESIAPKTIDLISAVFPGFRDMVNGLMEFLGELVR